MINITKGLNMSDFDKIETGTAFLYTAFDAVFTGQKMSDKAAIFYDPVSHTFFWADRFSNCFMNKPNAKEYKTFDNARAGK